jgi:hypothetical protein
MKKLILLLLMASSYCLYAQPNTLPDNGNVGIGTTNPLSKLDVNGNILISSADLPMGLNMEVGGTVPLLNMSMNFREANKNNAYIGAGFRIDTRTNFAPLFQWLKRDAGGENESMLMSLTSSGNLGLGISNAAEKLAVNGNIRSKEVKVEATNWPDYVFHQDYQLPTLAEIEQQIKLNGHLPDMPSAKEVEANGIALGEMVKLQQQKIEELTLHLIKKEKEIDLLGKEVLTLKSESENKISDILQRLAKIEQLN